MRRAAFAAAVILAGLATVATTALTVPAFATVATTALTVPAFATVATTALTVPASAPPQPPGEPVPHCQPVLIVTPWRQFTVKACDSGLRDPAPGKQWAWTVDGSALKGGAVVFGSQIPRQH